MNCFEISVKTVESLCKPAMRALFVDAPRVAEYKALAINVAHAAVPDPLSIWVTQTLARVPFLQFWDFWYNLKSMLDYLRRHKMQL